LEFAAQPYADYGASLVRRGLEGAVVEKFLEYLSSSKEHWDAVHLDKMMPGDPFVQGLLTASHQRHVPTTAHTTQQVRRLMKQSYAAQGTSRSLDKALKRLAAQGILHLDVYTRPEEIEPRLDGFFHLHEERFSAKGLRSPLADSRHRNFYRNIVRGLAPKGFVWLSSLTCGTTPVAMRFSFLRGRTLHLYSTCFAGAFARYSPSMLQLRMLLNHAFSNGVEIVDFGVGESPHKEHSGVTVEQALLEVELYSGQIPRLESDLFHAAQRARSNSVQVQRVGKLLRRLFPYEMLRLI